MDKEKLRKYTEEGLSYNQIRKLTNKSQTTIRYWLKKYELKTNYKRKKKCISKLIKKVRDLRKKEYRRKNAYERYHSDKWPTIECMGGCHSIIKKRLSTNTKQFCKKCWKTYSSSKKTKKGYTYIIPIKHFGKLDTQGKIHLHRFIGELVLNRPLEKKEVVHHIDNNSFNNEPNNLCILSRCLHASYHNWILNNTEYQCGEETLRKFVESKDNIIFLGCFTGLSSEQLINGKIRIAPTKQKFHINN